MASASQRVPEARSGQTPAGHRTGTNPTATRRISQASNGYNTRRGWGQKSQWNEVSGDGEFLSLLAGLSPSLPYHTHLSAMCEHPLGRYHVPSLSLPTILESPSFLEFSNLPLPCIGAVSMVWRAHRLLLVLFRALIFCVERSYTATLHMNPCTAFFSIIAFTFPA